MSNEERKPEDPSTGDEAGEPDEASERFDRRGFFSQGFRNLLKPVADMVEKRLDNVRMPAWDDDDHGIAPPSSAYRPDARDPASRGTGSDGRVPQEGRALLRPPGAIAEDDFLDTCLSSGECISACPVHAIEWTRSDDSALDGKPFIDPRSQACVVCDDLSCMQVCPSGALMRLQKDEIRMGLAVLHDEHCLRTTGEDCQICVDKCPLGAKAIDIPYVGSPVEVHASACTGCGVCEMYCPTEPRAIVVEALPETDAPPREPDEPGPEDGGSYLPMD